MMIILVLITDGIWVLGTSQLFKHLKSVKAGALRLLSNPLLLILPPFHPPSVIQQKKKKSRCRSLRGYRTPLPYD